jgi:antitoxin VapB
MAFHIRDQETDTLVRALARQKGVGLTEAVKLAVQGELKREREAVPLWERLKPIQDRVLAHPPTGLEADKAFFDELSGDL